MKGIYLLKKLFITPRSKNKDIARRELILSIILIGFIVLSLAAFISTTVNYFLLSNKYTGVSPVLILLTFFMFCGLLYLSKKGKVIFTGYIIVIVLFYFLLDVVINSGVKNPLIFLLSVLIIVISSIVLGSTIAFVSAGGIGLLFFIMIILQAEGLLTPQTSWEAHPLNLADALIFALSFGYIAVIAWLYNREIHTSFERARESERALRKERDQLEIKVEERTRELKRTQLEQLRQMQKFADFGKKASIVLHDLANPLNLVSLNLEALGNQVSKKEMNEIRDSFERAIQGTKLMEQYLQVARTQIQIEDRKVPFSIKEELERAIQMMEFKAKKNKVTIEFRQGADVRIVGSPMQFNHVITNLLSNAIDSYDSITKQKKRTISVSYKDEDNSIIVTVKDWGCGIKSEYKRKIFTPLFTTKEPEKGTGIGLSISQDIVSGHFRGNISFESRFNKGSTFFVTLPKHFYE